MSHANATRTYCVLKCIPHDRLKRAWVVDLSASEWELPAKTILLQERPTAQSSLRLGFWIVVGWDTRGMVLIEPMKGTRDNMLPGDRFHPMK